MFEEILRSEPAEFTRDEARAAIDEAAGALAVHRNADGDILIRHYRPPAGHDPQTVVAPAGGAIDIRQYGPLAGHDPQIVVPREEVANLVEAIQREMTGRDGLNQAATG